MATSYKVLGQSAPAATTETDVYTVPADTQAVISTIVIANNAGTAGTCTMRIRVAGAAAEQKQIIMPAVPVIAGDSTTLTLGLTMGAADVVSVNCSSADFSINICGSEIT